jgi:hypothetical protein
VKPNRHKLFALYLVLCSAMVYSGLQLFEPGARAQDEGAGTCCQVSSDCPGSKLCYLPGDKADCCRSGPGLPTCYGANYCLEPPHIE